MCTYVKMGWYNTGSLLNFIKEQETEYTQAICIISSKISTELVRYNFNHRTFKDFSSSDSFCIVFKDAAVEHNRC